MQETHLPPPTQVIERIRLCRQELAALKILLRAAEAAEKAEQARDARQREEATYAS